MRILSIETSCDDTGVAILEILGDKKNLKFNVLSNIVSSQIEVHKKYGGVYPMMAKREHQKNLAPVLVKALKEAKLLKIQNNYVANVRPHVCHVTEKILEREPVLSKKLISIFKKYQKPDIDLIAITNGPGLEPCLWVGVNCAKALAYYWKIPIISVNHIESHILVNILEAHKFQFPALGLIVSGGHTQLVLMKGIGKYKIIGETKDDAAGECFDKCAKILGLSYPGGPEIAKLAASVPRGLTAISPRGTDALPRPMINSGDYNFSFSGLKTAVLYKWRELEKNLSETEKQKIIPIMAKEIQQSIIDVLIKKTLNATIEFNVKSIILGGGVSANSELRRQFEIKIKGKIPEAQLIFPDVKLSTDNALMAAVNGYYKSLKNPIPKYSDWKKIKADGNLRI